MKIRWSRPAIDHLSGIRAYIASDNPEAAASVARSIIEAAELLGEFPSLGRPGRGPGTRELVVPGTPFIIPYRVVGDMIEIVAMLHGARRRPGGASD